MEISHYQSSAGDWLKCDWEGGGLSLMDKIRATVFDGVTKHYWHNNNTWSCVAGEVLAERSCPQQWRQKLMIIIYTYFDLEMFWSTWRWDCVKSSIGGRKEGDWTRLGQEMPK